MFFEGICQYLNWDNARFDYIGIGDEIMRGRPYPNIIFDMMGKLDIQNAGEVLKVRDTVADIQEGKNAKVITAVILSSTQPKEILLQENPDIVLTSLLGIKKVVSNKKGLNAEAFTNF